MELSLVPIHLQDRVLGRGGGEGKGGNSSVWIRMTSSWSRSCTACTLQVAVVACGTMGATAFVAMGQLKGWTRSRSGGRVLGPAGGGRCLNNCQQVAARGIGAIAWVQAALGMTLSVMKAGALRVLTTATKGEQVLEAPLLKISLLGPPRLSPLT